MTDIETIANSLLANFCTIRLPADWLPTQPNLEPTDWWATTKALRAEKRVVYDLRDRLRRVLIQNRGRFFDRLEPDPEGGWRIHVSSAMRMLALLDSIVGKRCEPGDPVDFDHEEFIIERLRELEWFE